MRTAKSLTELAAEIERRANAKRDLIAPVTKLEVLAQAVEPGKALVPQLAVSNGKVESYPINALAHGQLAEYVGIPSAYYKRLQQHDPALLAANVNRWLHEEPKNGEGKPQRAPLYDRRLVRVLDGQVRAFLSDKYRRLENEDVAEAILPVLLERDLLIVSCEVTERRLYIKALDRKIERDVPTGRKMGDGSHCIFDTVCPAITVSNSEVGFGALSIESGVYTKACTNLATFGASLRKYHTGARAELSDEVYQLLSDKTKRLTDAAVWSQVRDLVAGAFDEARFHALTDKLASASEQKIEGDVVEVIERVGRRFSFSQGEQKGILARLIEGADLTRYGLHAAVTNYAESVEDYDRATEFERLGGQVIDLPQSEWEVLAKAA